MNHDRPLFGDLISFLPWSGDVYAPMFRPLNRMANTSWWGERKRGNPKDEALSQKDRFLSRENADGLVKVKEGSHGI